MDAPLKGIRVIDWTIWQQGPVATAMLADMGAEVIKIEERVGGDPGRGMLRSAGLDLTGRPNFYFEATTPADITRALTKMFNQALVTAHITN